MRLFAASLLLAAAVLAAAPAAAQQARSAACRNAQTQAQMNACAAQEYRAADAELNQAYGRLRAQLNPARREKLRLAQRAWIGFRDATCEFESSEAAGGTMQPLLRLTCLATETQARTRSLREALDSPR